MKLHRLASSLATFLLIALLGGCSLVPEKRERDSLHNPFPQMKRIAVLPFFNQSSEPTVNSDAVAESYYAALQAIPGFEVLPIGVVKAQWLQYAATHGEPRTGADFQRLAKQMGVEALVVGAVTDFDAYYPPRMAMTVHWYAANEGFHEIPAGYGLPWGTDAEKQIPRRIAREAEFELARSQLATQTPLSPEEGMALAQNGLRPVSGQVELVPPQPPAIEDVFAEPHADESIGSGLDNHSLTTTPVFDGDFASADCDPSLPANWPDPTDLIPDGPSPMRPLPIINHGPVLSHTRLYRGDDSYFTNRLADYVETGDDARPGGWQGYLNRSDDFIRFCCHLHITEMLESRGGSDQSDLIIRWPVSRY